MVIGSDYIPERGEVIWLTFDPQAGHEQADRRPALIISPAVYNAKVGLALLCPITSQVKGYPFEANIPQGLPIEGVVLADQVKNLDWEAREAELIFQLPSQIVNEVLKKIHLLLSVES